MTVAPSLRPMIANSRIGLMGKPFQWLCDGSLTSADPYYVLPRE